MNNVLTLDNFSRIAVEHFVQTVVFVDDKIYASPPNGTVIGEKKASSPKARKPATKSAEEQISNKSDGVSEIQAEVSSFSPHDIQASFAEKSIVCSLHQPIKDEPVGIGSVTYKLCASADIVIIDWDLYGDSGKYAKNLIENLVLQSLKEDPHQLRLVLIYTDNPSLFDIADQISEKLIAKIADGIKHKNEDKGLAFHTLNARVVVLGKPANRLDEFKSFEVQEAELADRAVSEFCKLADGMLQSGILMGLATIRKQSRKILTKFHAGLDAAFLTHRALSQPHEEAFDHIASLLVSEIQAILEDSLESPLFPEAVVQDWCNKREFGKYAQSSAQGADFKAFAYDFCRFGSGAREKHRFTSAPSNKQLPTLLLPDKEKSNPPEPDMSSMEQLAVLMSHRTHYDNQRRFLRLGTILRERSGKKRFLLCLQPVCDSTRLTGSNPFLFCYMDESTTKVTHIVPDSNDFCELLLNPCKENRTIINFSANHKKRVTAKKGANTEYLFSDDMTSGGMKNEYQWIAQLKVEHAQRAAEQFARELGRVGLTESEWLRSKS